ncbi:ATP-binding protein [Magnetospirillum sp. UT-4]|uniref:ATP-binding protein n=1 Tax=Magnetospirillum sp. UT-4 TaxID=2681467 RepID=UPI00138253B4|nr:ATP-binding protein [Magnetospirillum sp. UT-4]CAA7613507.1 putative two component sensor histidine kinase protein [Magnetospirillum sp. UT-4]
MTRTWLVQRLSIPVFGMLLVALLWAGVMDQDRRSAALREAAYRLELINYARLLEAHTRSVVRGLDQVVMHLKAEYEENPQAFDLRTQVARSPILKGLSVQVGIISADGLLQDSTAGRPPPDKPINLADREHFSAHVESDSGRLFISKPVLGRASGKWSIQLARRINHKDGGFAGVMVVSLNPDYITDIYSKIDLGSDSTIVVPGRDGIVRARAAGADRMVGQDFSAVAGFDRFWSEPEGTAAGPSPIDGVERIRAFRQVQDYPLAVSVARPAASLAATHGIEHQLLMAGGLAGTLLILAGSAMLYLLAVRQQAIERRLRVREGELVATRAAVEQQNRDLAQFTEVLAHHLQEPVRLQHAFASRLKTLLGEALTEDAARALDHVVRGAARQRALLRDVQLYLSVAQLPAAAQACHVRRALDLALERLEGQIRTSGATIRGDSLDAMARMDRARLVDVLAALVENAIQHASPGVPPVIEVAAQAAPDGRTIITVADNGPGIAPEFRERVFRVFERLHNEPGCDGTGIGLALTRRIVEAAGGTVTIEAAPSGGTLVRIVLYPPPE